MKNKKITVQTMTTTLREFLVENGYEEVKDSHMTFMKEYSDIIYLVHITGATRDICGTPTQYLQKRQQLELDWKKWSGKEVEILDLVVTTSTKSENLMELIRFLDRVWIVDEVQNRVLLFDEQKDFDHLYASLERWLEKKDETETLPVRQYLVTITLFIANTILFLLMFQSGNMERAKNILEAGVQDWRAIFYQHEYYRFFSSQFLHFGWKHFFNNMVILLFAGSQLEPRIGSFRFFILYIFSGAIGGMASAYYSMLHQEAVISAGASGAIYGILGALFVDMLRDKTQIRYVVFRCIVLVGGSFYLMLSDTGVDHLAHIGGFLGGVCLCFMYTIKMMIDTIRQKRKASKYS